MKQSRALVRTQRRSLDEKLRAFTKARVQLRPKSGWVKAIREALGMTTRQLAARMNIQQSGVTLLEQREMDKKVTLETLERAARALNCELVYALVPTETLEKTVEEQALRSAREILGRTKHTMDLELQGAGSTMNELHEEELALEIKTKMDRRLWGLK